MRRFVVLGAAALFAFVLAVENASAVTLYSQSNNLRNEDFSGGVPCGGPLRGPCKISEIGAAGNGPTTAADVRVQCSLKNSAPGNYEVFWTCTTAARGCHNQACGFVSLGIVTVFGTGKGKFTATRDNNPFPGNYVHLDLIGPDLLTAVYAGIPRGNSPAGAAPTAAQPGDPTSR
jgi:hypothetical protein